MGDEFYASIKLVTGEEIFAHVSVDNNEDDNNPIIFMQNPVTMKMMNTPNGSMIKVKPWMEIPGDDFYLIKYDKIITMTEIKDKMVISIYNNYIEEEDPSATNFFKDNQIKVTKKMGYISSVEDARNSLEKIFKITKDTKES